MAYRWTCPYCRSEMYSASASKREEMVTCIDCGKEYPNPYYEDKP